MHCSIFSAEHSSEPCHFYPHTTLCSPQYGNGCDSLDQSSVGMVVIALNCLQSVVLPMPSSEPCHFHPHTTLFSPQYGNGCDSLDQSSVGMVAIALNCLRSLVLPIPSSEPCHFNPFTALWSPQYGMVVDRNSICYLEINSKHNFLESGFKLSNVCTKEDCMSNFFPFLES
jgi:hypothetical protein